MVSLVLPFVSFVVPLCQYFMASNHQGHEGKPKGHKGSFETVQLRGMRTFPIKNTAPITEIQLALITHEYPTPLSDQVERDQRSSWSFSRSSSGLGGRWIP